MTANKWATCTTPGCGNEGAPIEVQPDLSVVCGVCLNPITDLTDTPPEPIQEMPTWEL